LMFGRIRPRDIQLAIRWKVTVTVFQLDWLIEAKKYLTDGDRLHIHVKFDTGMGRLGIRSKEEAEPIFQVIGDDQSYQLDGIYTHFSTADEHDLSFINQQHQRFVQMIN